MQAWDAPTAHKCEKPVRVADLRLQNTHVFKQRDTRVSLDIKSHLLKSYGKLLLLQPLRPAQ